MILETTADALQLGDLVRVEDGTYVSVTHIVDNGDGTVTLSLRTAHTHAPMQWEGSGKAVMKIRV